MRKIIQVILLDILRNRIVLVYTLLMAAFSWSAFALENNESKGVLTLLNIMLLTVPLVSILFSTIYLYNSSEFIELLVSQPIRRSSIWLSLYVALGSSLVISFLVSAGIPLAIWAPGKLGWLMTAMGCLITLVFTGLASLSVILTRDKARGIGLSVLLWLYFALLFDGIVLFLLFQFSDYPIEKVMVILTASSPIDLARILVLLEMDVSALMGYTGALFRQTFGSTAGMAAALSVLLLWAIVPVYISLRKFRKRDL